MNRMFVRINEMWRRFFDLPPTREMMELNLEELMKAESEAERRPNDHNLDAQVGQKFCCTIFWDINDPDRKGDQSFTVTGQKMCDDMVTKNRAKGSRPLAKGAC